MAGTPIADVAGPRRQQEHTWPSVLPPGGFTLRPFEAWTASPIGPALVVVAAFSALSFCGRVLIGDQPFPLSGDPLGWNYIWLDVLNAVIFAYIPAAMVLLRRGIARDLVGLRPVLRCSDSQFREFIENATCAPNRRLAICGTLFVLVFALMPVYDPGFFDGDRPALNDPVLLSFMLRNAFTGWVVGAALTHEIGAAKTYRLLGRDHVAIDLLDTRPLHPFARSGLRSALAWILCVSIVPLFWLGPGAGSVNGVIIVSTIVLVTASLIYSISGVRHSVRREKHVQLGALRERIREQRPAALRDTESSLGEAAPAAPAAQLAGLIAYHDLIERAPEWPFDAPMIARLALFAALGLGSWLGAALVERLLESWF